MTSLPELPPPASDGRFCFSGHCGPRPLPAALVAAYYLLPFDRLSDSASVLLLVVGMVGVLLIVLWEVRAIIKSQYPAYKAVEALAITAPLFLLLFATAYFLLQRSTPASFGQPLSRTDALYFTVTTFSTVGYGDITAKSEGARLMVIGQMLADLVVLGFGVKVIFGAVEMGRQRQSTRPTAARPRPRRGQSAFSSPTTYPSLPSVRAAHWSGRWRPPRPVSWHPPCGTGR